MPRPSTYEPEIAAAILKEVASGKTIEAACQRAGIRRTTFLAQIKRHGLAPQLALAKAGKLPDERKCPAAAKKEKARPPQKTEKSGKTDEQPAQQLRAERPAACAARTSPQQRPEITCTWAPNRAAAVMLIEIGGIVLDDLRRELRRTEL